jgi:hypothetical protein
VQMPVPTPEQIFEHAQRAYEAYRLVCGRSAADARGDRDWALAFEEYLKWSRIAQRIRQGVSPERVMAELE